MNEFDIVTYAAAITTVGGAIFGISWKVIKKSSPFIKLYFDKLVGKMDEIVDENKESSRSINNHIKESEDYRRSVEEVQNSMLKKIEENSLTLCEHNNRITELELKKERRALEKEKQEFQDKKIN